MTATEGQLWETSDPRPGQYRGIETSASFMSRWKSPEFVVDGLLRAGMVYTLTALTGHAKTTLACLLAQCVLQGSPFADCETQAGQVLFLSGENPDNVRLQWAAAAAGRADLVTHPNMYWHDGHFDLNASGERLHCDAARLTGLRLIVADTLQAFHGAEDENSNVEMLKAARMFRALADLPSRPAVLIPAHPVKNAARDNLIPRGGGALLNELDGNLTLWRKDSIVELNATKLRGKPISPMKFELYQTGVFGMNDRRGKPSMCAAIRPISKDQEKQRTKDEESREDTALAAIRDNPAITCAALGELLGTSSSSAGRLLVKLREKKWIKQNGRDNALTTSGKAVLGDG